MLFLANEKLLTLFEKENNPMKKMFIAFLLLVAIKVNSQHDAFGVNLNIGVSKITNSILDDYDTENNLGLAGSIGLYYDHYFNEHSFLELNPLFSLLSSNQVHGVHSVLGYLTNEERKIQMRSYYLSIPLKYGYEYNSFVYSGGVYAGLNVSSFVTGDDYFNPGEKSTFEIPTYDQIDFGVVLGIEKILNNGMVLGLNYSHGLANMIDDHGGYGYEVKNRQLTFGIKYEFYRKIY